MYPTGDENILESRAWQVLIKGVSAKNGIFVMYKKTARFYHAVDNHNSSNDI